MSLNEHQFGQLVRDLRLHIHDRGEHLGETAHQMGLHPSLGGSQVPEVIQGRTSRHVMAMANVRQTPQSKPHPLDPSPDYHKDWLVDAPHLVSGYHNAPEYGYRPHHEELWTSQDTLHAPTLKKYAQGNIQKPQHEDFGDDIDPHYEPETYEHQGKRWLYEGHHRTVATRLAHRYD